MQGGLQSDNLGLSAGRFLLRDIFFYLFVGSIIMMCLLGWLVNTLSSNDDPSTREDESVITPGEFWVSISFVAAAVAGVVLSFWRYHTWARLIRRGVVLSGEVEGYSTVSPTFAVIGVSYNFEGRRIETAKTIGGLLPKIGKTVKQGDKITVLVDSKASNRFLILDLYMESPR